MFVDATDISGLRRTGSPDVEAPSAVCCCCCTVVCVRHLPASILRYSGIVQCTSYAGPCYEDGHLTAWWKIDLGEEHQVRRRPPSQQGVRGRGFALWVRAPICTNGSLLPA